MAVLSSWCSLVVVAPVVLFLAVVERDLPPMGSHVGAGSEASEEEADEAAHLQKAVSKADVNASRRGAAGAGVRFFASKDVLKTLPKPAAKFPNLPKHLQGTFWMDQHGAYGYSNLRPSSTFDDLVFNFGCSDVHFDPAKRKVWTFTSGLCWTWFNSAEAYHVVAEGQQIKSGYTFAFNSDYSACTVQPFMQHNGMTISVPKAAVSYTMKLLTPPPGACPPRKGASAMENSKCAFARRDTVWYDAIPPFYHNITYYIFKIGDENNRPTDYFPAYLQWALQTSKPDRMAFMKNFGRDLPIQGYGKDVQMVSTIPMS
uniref:Uncharacterized protein n=1 Tax=Alexandrium catenella TaxID=2925 RepID=A0A7S1WUJ4_ALECA|mmetsp:Transcript_90801/g.241300  ORF Transcript_90801/g.241300 Transcript_90801/m.241300 type:complete len:315 (+) Transcript_90801:122-1066(+)|eukprot:CAMPEP_0171206180 /NCGR_PEP_ID=MMETSP0790-20130122/26930_1 /TAXON_ID=2925 /ORGANISM="Alexandrium catenella, Strain OF101" /LENGTH=314 /DNA_ID=CAMNT_0011671717 /DNA_START=121 /DNA_END=1065 /DNA_ORIENTATION=-